MSKTYLSATTEASSILNELRDEYFPFTNQLEHDLLIRLQFVLGDEKTPALTKGGWPCEALISVPSTKMRAAGAPDVLIELDGGAWVNLIETEKKALIHHELEHMELQKLKRRKNEAGEEFYSCKLDVLERPVVKLRKHDYECGGFARIHELYADASPEARQLEVASAHLSQQVFAFARAV